MNNHHITTIEIEVELAEYFNVRANTVVTNISWGMSLHECDVLIITKAGYAWEVEIKVSLNDLKRDKLKKHKHRSDRIKYLYFAIPDFLEKHIKHIPSHAGIISIRKSSEREKKYMHAQETYKCEIIRKPKQKGKYKWSEEEKNQALRLGCMRVWTLKRKIIKITRQIESHAAIMGAKGGRVKSKAKKEAASYREAVKRLKKGN